jgi:hypothetical protein
MTSLLTYDAVISAPNALPTDLTTAHYDAEAHEIVVTFREPISSRLMAARATSRPSVLRMM